MPAGRILLKSISESRKLASLKTDGARLLYTWLIPHVDVNGCFSGDIAVIKGQVFTRLRKTDKEIDGQLKDLASVGLIVRYESNGDQFIFLPSFEEKQPHLNKDREATPRIPLPTPDQLKTGSGPDPDKIPLKLKVKLKEKENVGILPTVISYLNEKTGKHFLPDSAGTIKLINGRLAEGRTLENFKHVIDVKAGQWLGDSKMDAYLRPDTLFAQSNFESYLNERVIVAKGSAEKRVGVSKTAESSAAAAEIKAANDRIHREYISLIESADNSGNRKESDRLRTEAQSKFESEASAILARYSKPQGEARP
jgi:uncharacterized phage protein (TIGR02220 family)